MVIVKSREGTLKKLHAYLSFSRNNDRFKVLLFYYAGSFFQSR